MRTDLRVMDVTVAHEMAIVMDARMARGKKSGFSMLEMVCVMAIVGVLGMVSAPTYITSVNDSKVRATQENERNLQMAVQKFTFKNDAYPTLTDFDSGLDGYLAGGVPNTAGTFGVGGVKAENDIIEGKAVTGDGGWVYDSETGTIVANLENDTYGRDDVWGFVGK